MTFTPLFIPDLILFQPRVFEDERGFFFESYQQQRFAEAGINANFVQDNHSRSLRGVLRGLHYQIRQPQGKLGRVIEGEIYNVAVDLRRASPTFGKWAGVVLSASNKQQLWVPPGFAHGFYTLSQSAEVLYKASDYYAPQWERTLRWDDPTLQIDWHYPKEYPPVLSAKDAAGSLLAQAELFD